LEAGKQGIGGMEIPKNSGFTIITPTLEQPGVIAITGTGRSGSTCLAKLLRATGVHVTATVGHTFGKCFSENVAFNNALASKDCKSIFRLTKQMPPGQWCFKRPGEFMHLKFGLDLLRPLRPCVIVAVRDTLASALCEINFQEKRQSNIDVKYWIQEYSLRNQRLLREAMIESTNTPTAFVSYEKLMAHPKYITHKLCEFVRCKFNEQAVEVVGKKETYYQSIS
jgi:hypothetical protein